MATWSNTILYHEDWTVKLQERLDKPTTWKEVCKVEYTDTRVLNNPYLTDAVVQTTARNAAYTHQNVTVTIDTITIDAIGILPQAMDRADLSQSTYMRQMEMAERQGTLIDEFLESKMLAEHAQWTDFDNASIGGGAGNITVSSTNIDDIIRGIKREINEANGQNMAARNGIFIVWRAADFELLEQFMQANGFTTADNALKNGAKSGVDFMGVTHYASNSHTSGHVFAGVKKAFHLGIVKGTWGQTYIDEEPATADGAVSAVAVITRVDYKFKAWTKQVPVLFDVLVA